MTGTVVDTELVLTLLLLETAESDDVEDDALVGEVLPKALACSFLKRNSCSRCSALIFYNMQWRTDCPERRSISIARVSC